MRIRQNRPIYTIAATGFAAAFCTLSACNQELAAEPTRGAAAVLAVSAATMVTPGAVQFNLSAPLDARLTLPKLQIGPRHLSHRVVPLRDQGIVPRSSIRAA